MTEHRPRYRIVHPTKGTLRVLGYTDAWAARVYALDPDAAKLRSELATGELLLIDQETNTVVARRELWFEGAAAAWLRAATPLRACRGWPASPRR